MTAARCKDLPAGQMDAVDSALKAVGAYGEACLDHGMSEEGEDTSSEWAAARDALVQLLAFGVTEGRRQAARQLVGLADQLDDDCAGHGVASAISPGLRNAADVLTGDS